MKEPESGGAEDQNSKDVSPQSEPEEAAKVTPDKPTSETPIHSTELQNSEKKPSVAEPESEHTNGASTKRAKSDIRVSIGTFGLVFVLTLATWVVFYSQVPLDAAGTAVVAGGWLVILLAGKWFFRWMRTATGRRNR